MHDRPQKDRLARRSFLAVASTALAAAGLPSAKNVAGQQPEFAPKAKTDQNASNLCPTDAALDAANPDSYNPPTSDAGGLPPFKYPFSLGEKSLHDGGWLREVTVCELEIAKTISAAQVRLTAGGVRELHWHPIAEWSFMLSGSTRITCIDADGKSFVTDLKKGDLWYFPGGVPHSLQVLDLTAPSSLLVFDDASSERETVHGEPVKYEDPAKHFRFTGARATCQMEAEVEVPSIGFSWKSDPLSTSKRDFAIIGEEVNGRFYES